MATEIYLRKELGRLVPDDEAAEDALRKIKVGEVLRIKFSRPRNYQFHKKFFALLDVAFQNQDHYQEPEAFRAEVIIRAGFFDTHNHMDGSVSLISKSISFAKMDETEFAWLYEKAIGVILETFLIGTDQATLEEEVGRILQFA
jgi:hypothetical protein